MLRKTTIILLILMMSMFSIASAESLWVENSLYSDTKASRVGDLLTVLINETSTATRSGTANNSKDASLSLEQGKGSLLDWITAHSVGGKDSFKTQGNISNTNNVQASITVQVVQVLPTGNLAIQGIQEIKQNKDVQKIVITGEVRPLDIKSDNTISSRYIANAKIDIVGKGPITDKQRQGFLTQLWNFLF